MSSGNSFAIIKTLGPDLNSYTDTGLLVDTRYFYRIRAINNSGNSPYTTEATALTSATAPAAPTGLSAAPKSSTAIILNWTDGSSTETGFQIERSQTAGSSFTLIFTTPANALSFMDDGLLPKTKYYYRMRAINAGGNSNYTTEIFATTADAPPTAPTGLRAVATSGTSIDLSWIDKSNNETGFVIERSLTPGTGFNLIATTEANAGTYSNDGLAKGTTYYYRIKAKNEGGSSTTYTKEVAVTLFIEGVTQLCANLFCDNNGSVGIGTQAIPTGYKLAVKGKVMAEGVKVALQSAWPDYVFDKDHVLTDIPSLKKYIATNGHLPNIPSAETVQKDGIDMAQINVLLLEKIEELSLYLIEMDERMKILEAENNRLKETKTKP